MKYTNKHNLPTSIANALQSDNYDLSDAPENIVSVTTLIEPPRIKMLSKRHYKDLVCDVTDNIWMLFGTSVHHILELGNKKNKNTLAEERWFLNVATLKVYALPTEVKIDECEWYDKNAWYVSGKFDNYIDECIEDYKVSSVWTYLYNKTGKAEHHLQININALAMKLLCFPVKTGRIIMILRDFLNSKAGQGDYPTIPIQSINVPIKDDKEIINYIRQRIKIYKNCIKLSDEMLPDCTLEERWYQKGTLAIMKDDNKKATKLFGEDDVFGAENYVAACKTKNKKSVYKIVKRQGVNKRCEQYCNAKTFCNFFNKNAPQIFIDDPEPELKLIINDIAPKE